MRNQYLGYLMLLKLGGVIFDFEQEMRQNRNKVCYLECFQIYSKIFLKDSAIFSFLINMPEGFSLS